MPEASTRTQWFAPTGRQVRRPKEKTSNGVLCPSCGSALSDRGRRELSTDTFADPLVAEEAAEDTVTTVGWECEDCDLVLPKASPTREIAFDPEVWKPVCIAFDGEDGSHWVPVRREAFQQENQSSERPTVCHVDEPHDVSICRGPDGEASLATVDVGEPGWLGNPYRFVDNGGTWPREEAVEMYMQAVFQRIDDDPEFVAALGDLKGARLGCTCRTSDQEEPLCHGDVLADIIDRL